MTDLPTTQQLRTDEALLRRTITMALEPGPWTHDVVAGAAVLRGAAAIVAPDQCQKCGKMWHPNHSELASERYYWAPGHDATRLVCRTKDCPIPDAFDGPLEVAAAKLMRRCITRTTVDLLEVHVSRMNPSKGNCWRWFSVYATAEEQCICCLIALGHARKDGR